MAWTTTDLTTIEAAIAQGVLHVQYSDRSVTYRSVKELLDARDAIKGSLTAAAGSGVMTHLTSFSKG